MSFLNFYFGRLAYSDASPLQNPKQKNFDFVTAKEGLEVKSPVSIIKEVLPGQTLLLDSTARTIASNLTSSQFALELLSGSDIARLRWTGVGTAPSFRTLRAINYGTSPATTTYAASRLSPTAVLITLSGAGVDLSPVVQGDEVYFQPSDGVFTSPVNPSTVGFRYTVLSATSNTLTVRDSGNIGEETGIALGADYDSVLRCFSSAGVQVGDKIRFNAASAFNSENKSHDLEVQSLSDRDIMFYNPNLIPETVTSGVATPFSFYDRLINFMAIEANGPIKLKFNGGSEELPLCEFSPGSAMFASTMSAISVHAVNSTNYTISVSVQSCSF